MSVRRGLILLCPVLAITLAACNGDSSGGTSGAGAEATTGGTSAAVTAETDTDTKAEPAQSPARRPAACDNMLDEPYTTRDALTGGARMEGAELMLRFVHMTDAHIIDDDGQAMIGVSFLDPLIPRFEASMRLQEEYSDEVLNSLVAGLNDCQQRFPSEFALITGDSADITTVGETRRLIDNLDGGFDRVGAYETRCRDMLPENASPARVRLRCTRFTGRGVADTQTRDLDTDSFLTQLPLTRTIQQLLATETAALSGRAADGSTDASRQTEGRAPGLPQTLRCDAGGDGCVNERLDMPYLMAFGNHDGYFRGTVPFERGASVVATLFGRRYLLKQTDFIDEFFFTAEQPGPVGHGFQHADQERRTDDDPRNDGYYAFDTGDGRFRMIVLNTIIDGQNTRLPGNLLKNPFALADGTVDAQQFQWLQDELAMAYENEQLVVLFSHHPDLSFVDFSPLSALVPIEVTAAELDAELASWPHLIAWVAGHTHRHRIRAFDVSEDTGSNGTVEVDVDCKVADDCRGFWQIETSSLIDAPQQQRLIEIFDNDDGTGVIRGTVLNHAFERSRMLAETDDRCQLYLTDPEAVAAQLSDAGMNGICMEGGTRTGQPEDRNVDLVFPMPSFAARSRASTMP